MSNFLRVMLFITITYVLLGCESKSEITPLSFVSILINYNELDGQKVEVKGYVSSPTGNVMLFLTEDSAKYRDFSSSIKLAGVNETDLSDCLNSFSTVFGILEVSGVKNSQHRLHVYKVFNDVSNSLCWKME
ncbi:hypothetical protein [Agaribacterium sp. ZY112]|uniref:hypothetical protein n=1 Tax=Agaribacterium sp. ZY112 TaxID=3233574 RepID=UPI00352460B9